MIDAFEAGASIQEAVDLVLDKIREDIEETEEGLSDLASAISNFPSGFKVAFARFNATIAEAAWFPVIRDGFGVPGATLSMVPAETYGIYLESGAQIVIQTAPGEDGEVTLQKIEKAALVSTRGMRVCRE
ncbi:MAG: hypothetical protein ACREM1_24105 [Longimicrobiales bacterium]